MNQLAWRCIVITAWLSATALGWFVLLQHAYEPAITAWDARHLPSLPASNCCELRILVFAHPFCPCTRATLHKLDESLTRLPVTVSIQVVFETSGLGTSAVESSSNVAIARRLPRVDVQFDESGHEARRLGATVSGEVFAFNRDGRCLFHGGLTAARGHQGDSAGQQQLERLADGKSREIYNGPVFGCALSLNSTKNGM